MYYGKICTSWLEGILLLFIKIKTNMRKVILFFAFLTLAPVVAFSQGWMQNMPKTRSESDFTFYDYRDAFNQWCREKRIDNEGYYMEDGKRKKAYGWKQFKRWEIQMDGWYDRKTGKFHDIDIWREYEKHGLLNRGPADDFGLGNWVSLAYGEEGYGNDGNGRINCMAFHPTNPDKYWIGAAWGGIWMTEDNGNTWTPQSDFIAQTAIGAIAIPDDYDVSQTIYLGTGDRGYFYVRGVGILKSTDGGATWQNTSLSHQSPVNLAVGRILIQPSDLNVLFAAASNGIYKSTDAGENWTRKKILRGKDMEFHPLHDSIIYASTYGYGTDTVYIYRSADWGETWTQVFDASGLRIELGVSPDNPPLFTRS
jgi:hypothetical protein